MALWKRRLFRYFGEVHNRRYQASKIHDQPNGDPALRALAREAFLTATQNAPDDILALAGLGRTYLDSSQSHGGIEPLERARAIGAWNGPITIDLGRLYAAADRVAEARTLWREVVRVGLEDDVASATALLAGVGQSDE